MTLNLFGTSRDQSGDRGILRGANGRMNRWSS